MNLKHPSAMIPFFFADQKNRVMLEVLIEENRSRQSKEMIVYCGSQHSCSSGDGSRS
jgi:hypothetical protein